MATGHGACKATAALLRHGEPLCYLLPEAPRLPACVLYNIFCVLTRLGSMSWRAEEEQKRLKAEANARYRRKIQVGIAPGAVRPGADSRPAGHCGATVGGCPQFRY